jgi:hypothetical protein
MYGCGGDLGRTSVHHGVHDDLDESSYDFTLTAAAGKYQGTKTLDSGWAVNQPAHQLAQLFAGASEKLYNKPAVGCISRGWLY